MKAVMARCVAIVLLVGVSTAARAQQNSQTNQNAAPGNQSGQQQEGQQKSNAQQNQFYSQQAQSGQQPSAGGNQSNSQSQGAQQPSNVSYSSNNAFGPYIAHFGPSVDQPMNYQWTVAGNNGIWVSGLNSDINLTVADDVLREHLDLPKDQGLVVTGLAANAPPAQLGIEQNDVLLELAGKRLSKPEELESYLKSVGDHPVPLVFLRAGKRHTIQVQPIVRVTIGPVQPEPPAFWIGVSVSPLEPALRSQLGLQNRGLLATEVIKGSPAAQAELKLHDILLTFDGKLLDSQEKLVELVQSTGEKSVPLELIREGKTLKLSVAPSRRKADQVSARRAYDFYYQMVRPGAVLNGNGADALAPGASYRANPDGNWIADLNAAITSGKLDIVTQLDQAKLGDASALPRRIDELDAEVKQLRKAIEGLTKILKDKK
jgi:membrane-associated protease RseP (regulator of RpoE activity)